MKCAKCGTEFEEGIFCPECGTKYDEEEAIAAEAMRRAEAERTRMEREREWAEQERLKKEEEAKEKIIQKNKKHANELAVSSFVLGVLSMFLSCNMGIFEVGFSSIVIYGAMLIIPIVLAIVAIKKKAESKTLAIISPMLVGFSVVILLILGTANPDDQNKTPNNRNNEITENVGATETDPVSDNSIETSESVDSKNEDNLVTTSQITTTAETTTTTVVTTTTETETEKKDFLSDDICGRYIVVDGYWDDEIEMMMVDGWREANVSIEGMPGEEEYYTILINVYQGKSDEITDSYFDFMKKGDSEKCFLGSNSPYEFNFSNKGEIEITCIGEDELNITGVYSLDQ